MASGFLSLPEVATKHSIPLRTVQEACKSGALPCERLGRFYLVLPESAEEFAEGWRRRKKAQVSGNEP